MTTPINIENHTADVIISGLGPTGLTLGHLLARRGIRILILEREPVFYGNARAVYTDDECMRVFQEVGVANELHKDMLFDMPVQFVLGDGTPMGQYVPLQRPFGWPVVNFFYQPYLETTLTQQLEKYANVTVMRGREVRAFEQDQSGVTVTHVASKGTGYGQRGSVPVLDESDCQRVRGKYLIACDGGRSTIRTRLGIELSGRSFPEPWLVVDLRVKDGVEALRHLPYFNFYCDPDLPTVSCPQPDGYHRFEFMLKPGQTKEYMEHPDTIRALLSRHVDPDQFEIMRKLVYTFNALVAERWREGRIILAGDAAHMTPQFMGQGMSSGVRDAFNLAWKLDAVLKGRAGDELLDSYETERSHHAKAMIDASVRLKNLVSISNPVTARVRNSLLVGLQIIPPLKEYLREGGFKPKPRYCKGEYFGLPRSGFRGAEGALLPQPEVCDLEGRHFLLDDVLGNGFSLVGLGVDPREHLSETSLSILEAVDTLYLTLYAKGMRPQGHNGVARSTPVGLVEMEEQSDLLHRWFRSCGVGSNAIAIIRPDKFVFGVVNPGKLNDAIASLQQKLGETSATSLSISLQHAAVR